MKVLFVSSGNAKTGISPIIKSQGASLKSEGIDVDYYGIKGKGLKGYLRNIGELKKIVKQGDYKIVHAHYGHSAIVAFFARNGKKIVVSFMGDDLIGSNNFDGSVSFKSKVLVKINKLFARFFFNYNIVKSSQMLKILNVPKSSVVANGVDFKRFYEIDRKKAREHIGEDIAKKQVLFCANPTREEKNFKLAKEAVDLLNDTDVELKTLHGIDQNELVYHFNAADCIILTSFHEGSPNVVKEAMACNTPIVSTDVGDVRQLIKNTSASYLTSYEVDDVAEKIKMALDFDGRTTGRKDVAHLESDIVAKKISTIYNKILEN